MHCAYSVFFEHGADNIANRRHIFGKVGCAPCSLRIKIAPVRRLIALRCMGVIYKHLRGFRQIRAQRNVRFCLEHGEDFFACIFCAILYHCVFVSDICAARLWGIKDLLNRSPAFLRNLRNVLLLCGRLLLRGGKPAVLILLFSVLIAVFGGLLLRRSNRLVVLKKIFLLPHFHNGAGGGKRHRTVENGRAFLCKAKRSPNKRTAAENRKPRLCKRPKALFQIFNNIPWRKTTPFFLVHKFTLRKAVNYKEEYAPEKKKMRIF